MSNKLFKELEQTALQQHLYCMCKIRKIYIGKKNSKDSADLSRTFVDFIPMLLLPHLSYLMPSLPACCWTQ